MKAVRDSQMPFFSVLGIPLMALGALILCLWHPPLAVRPDTGAEAIIILQHPDPRLDKCLSVCLRQQAKEVARCRRLARPAGLAQAVAGYNLVARECTPAVFQTTGLPPSLDQ
jgi:hypothetical protein